MKVMSIFGTRPEAVKMAPVVKAVEAASGLESVVCVTAQHRELLDQVLTIFDITPDHDLDMMQHGQTHSDITARALKGLEAVMIKEQPDLVLVHGDTATTFAGALAAFYQKIPVGHVEAGLRTYDKYQPYPEEMNRKLTGALTDLHFAPTETAKKHLLLENVDETTIDVTGNTAIDVLSTTFHEGYRFSVDALNTIDYNNKRVIAMTAHRHENLGEPLANICKAVRAIADAHEDVVVVYAMHPNPKVQNTAKTYLKDHDRIHLLQALELEDMHNLMAKAFFVMTDSGGIQEEVPSLGKPVLVLREVTERPEGVEAGTLKLVGTDIDTITQAAETLLTDKAAYNAMAGAKNPYGDGHAAEKIVAAIKAHFNL